MTRAFPISLAALILVLAGCGSDSKPGKRTGGDGGTGGSGGILGEGGNGGFDGGGGAGGEGEGGAGGGGGEGGEGGGDGETVVRSLRISSGNLSSATLLVSKKLVLTAEAFGDGWGMMPVPDATIVWTVSNPDVATVESEGVDEMERKTATIRTLAPGLVTVVVTSPQAEDGLEATYDIEVLEGTIDDPLFTIDSIAVDGGVSCGISDGTALCWGDNFQGQSGTGSEEFALLAPTEVAVAKDVAMIAPGATHGCAVDVDGGVHCWGQNWDGQLGADETAGKVDSSRLPLPVASDRIFRSVAVGQSHSCALDVDGSAWCWGANWSNELGLGAEAEKQYRIPAPVVGDHVFQTIVAGSSFTCGLDVTGQAWCWGMKASALGIGEVPDSDPPIVNFPTPTKVKGDHRFTAIDAGWYHVCAVDEDGAAWCWGRGGSGQIGVPAESEEMFIFEQWEPAQVQGGKHFVSITAGNNHSCGVDEDGAAWCWGGNETAALGTGDLESSSEPRAVFGGLLFDAVSAGSLHSCGYTKDGGAYCWGSSMGGQLGTGVSDQTRPFPVPVVPTAEEKE